MTAAVNQLYEQRFQIADEDRDNVISGNEAVKFLFRSGLSQAVLGQVRELLRSEGSLQATSPLCLYRLTHKAFPTARIRP